MHYDKDFGVECRIARFHNIYGPYGTWKGGREKAPAAFCRKVQCPYRRIKCCAMLPPLSSCHILPLHKRACAVHLLMRCPQMMSL